MDQIRTGFSLLLRRTLLSYMTWVVQPRLSTSADRLSEMLSERKVITVVFLEALLCSVYACSTFKNVHMTLHLYNGTQPKNTTLSGCIERIAFNGETVVQIEINNQNVPRLKRDSVRNMAKLTVLKIRNCNLAKIDVNAFRNVPRLKVLEVTRTRLTELKRFTFNNTVAMEYISFENNNIDLLEEKVYSDMEHLKYINLSNNKLDVLNRNWFYTLPSILYLDISHNSIRTLPRKAFIHLRTLQHVALDSNNIESIQDGAFEGLTNLTYLGLRGNLLKIIPANAFPVGGNFTISYLNIEGNRLGFIDDAVFTKLTIGKCSLDGNPWKCTCIETIRGHIFGGGGELIASEVCQKFEGPVCVIPIKNDNSNPCQDVDEESIELYYKKVRTLKHAEKCVRLN